MSHPNKISSTDSGSTEEDSPLSRIHRKRPPNHWEKDESCDDEDHHSFRQNSCQPESCAGVNEKSPCLAAESNQACQISGCVDHDISFRPPSAEDAVQYSCALSQIKLSDSRSHADDNQERQDKSPSDFSLDDTSLLDFSELQLKMKSPEKVPSPNASPAERNSTRIDSQSLGSQADPKPILFPGAASGSHESCNIQNIPEEHRPFPVCSPHLQPVGLPEMKTQQPRILQPKETNQPCKIAAMQHHIPKIYGPDLSCHLPLPALNQSALQSRACTIDVLQRESASGHEPDKLYQTSSTQMSPLLLRETAPPNEIVLHPASLPQISLGPGSSIKIPSMARDDPATSVEWRKASCGMPTSSLAFSANIESLPPPPSYDECVKQGLSLRDKMYGGHHQPLSPLTKASYQPLKPARSACGNHDSPPLYKSSCQHDSGVDGRCCTSDYGPNIFASGHGTYTAIDDQVSQIHRATRERSTWEPPRTDHQLLAFISCLFCWPVGLVAIYYSNMSHMLNSEGDFEQAHTYARLAFIASVIGLASGSIAYIIMFIYERAI